MEVEAFYIALGILVFMQKVDAALTIIPTKLQLFEYESLSLKCSGFDAFTECSIYRRTERDISTCGFSKWGVSTKSSCTIKDVYLGDSGEYWCEAGGGERSHSVNISISAGSVILENPVHPVTEGEAVKLRCRTKTTSSNLPADFYKDGLLIQSSSTREMTICTIAKSDEGHYKCRVSDESPESWLAVRASHGEKHTSPDFVFLIFRNIFPVVMMALLLLLLGRLHWWKLQVKSAQTRPCEELNNSDST